MAPDVVSWATMMSCRCKFVGSGDAFGSGGRWQTCIQLAASGQTLLVDCGATSLVALKAQRIDPNTIDAVVVTHLHGDHFGGLPFLILDGQFSGRSTPSVLAGPPGTADRLAAAMEVLFPGSSRVHGISPSRWSNWAWTEHRPGSVRPRCADGRWSTRAELLHWP